jgi:hypothetical protein
VAATFVSGPEERPRAEQTRLLQFRVESGSFGGMENHVSEQIVSASAVASGTAHQRVVSVAIENTVAQRALHVAVCEGNAQASFEHSYIQRRVVVKTGSLARSGVHVQASALSANQVEVGTT